MWSGLILFNTHTSEEFYVTRWEVEKFPVVRVQKKGNKWGDVLFFKDVHYLNMYLILFGK